MGAGKEEDEGGLAPTEDDDAASVYFSRRQALCPLSTEGMDSIWCSLYCAICSNDALTRSNSYEYPLFFC